MLRRRCNFDIIGNMESKTAVAALAALAQESRLAIFRLLVAAGPRGIVAGDIASKLDLPAATLSFHLKVLSAAGLVDAEQQGRYIIYTARFARMADLVDFLTEKCCSGNTSALECARLPRLRAKR